MDLLAASEGACTIPPSPRATMTAADVYVAARTDASKGPGWLFDTGATKLPLVISLQRMFCNRA